MKKFMLEIVKSEVFVMHCLMRKLSPKMWNENCLLHFRPKLVTYWLLFSHSNDEISGRFNQSSFTFIIYISVEGFVPSALTYKFKLNQSLLN